MRRAIPLAIVLTFVISGVALAYAWRTGVHSAEAETELHRLINAEHTRVCGVALAYDSQLAWAARYKAMDMGYRDYFAHASPEGRRMWEFYTRAGIPYRSAGEILAWNAYPDDLSVASAFRAFMGSIGHRDQIRSCTFTRFGAGAFKVASGKHYYAVEFTRP